MKKVLIVLLSVLLALTFISCEKDKSGEVIQNYEDFINSYQAPIPTYLLINLAMKYGEKSEDSTIIKVDTDFKDAELDDIKKIMNISAYEIKDLLGVDTRNITIDSVESISGGLKGEIHGEKVYTNEDKSSYRIDYYNDNKCTASDIVIKFKYTTYGYSYSGESDNVIKEDIDGELKINMNYSYKVSEGKELNVSASSLSLQGISYKDITYSRNEKYIFSSATVGGAGVELRLLNAGR